MEKPPLQFSVAALLLTVAVVAGDLALMLQLSTTAANLAFIALMPVLLAFLAIGLVYGRDSSRPFCIGAAFPLIMAFGYATFHVDTLLDNIWPWIPRFGQSSRESDMKMHQHFFGATLLSSIALGYLCVGFRWLIERRQPPDA